MTTNGTPLDHPPVHGAPSPLRGRIWRLTRVQPRRLLNLALHGQDAGSAGVRCGPLLAPLRGGPRELAYHPSARRGCRHFLISDDGPALDSTQHRLRQSRLNTSRTQESEVSHFPADLRIPVRPLALYRSCCIRVVAAIPSVLQSFADSA